MAQLPHQRNGDGDSSQLHKAVVRINASMWVRNAWHLGSLRKCQRLLLFSFFMIPLPEAAGVSESTLDLNSGVLEG